MASSPRACSGVAAVPGGVQSNEGAWRRACTLGSRQPPRQLPSSVALPRACAPASASPAPGSFCAQASRRAASCTLARRVPAPVVGCSSPLTTALAPGAVSVRSARPPGASGRTWALPASCASSVRTRSALRLSRPSAQWPCAIASRRRSARRSRASASLADSPRRAGGLARVGRACSATSKPMPAPSPVTWAVPSSGKAASCVCTRAGLTPVMRVSICQVPAVLAGAAAAPSPVMGAEPAGVGAVAGCVAGGLTQRPVDSTLPPPTCALSARTVATPPCQVTSASNCSTGSWRWSHGPAARLARSASTAQPGAPPSGSGVTSSRPVRWVRGASAQMAPTSSARTRACASGSGCAAQGVMRAVTWASGMSLAAAGVAGTAVAPAVGVVGGGAAGGVAAEAGGVGPGAKPASGGSAGTAGADALGAAGAACRSACACSSVSGPRSVACRVSGTGAWAPGTGAASAPAMATSTRIGACAVAAARRR